MIHSSGESTGRLLQLGAIWLRLLQSRGHRRERRFQFVRNRIEKRLLKFLRLTGDLRFAALFQSTFFVYKECELGGKGVEQFALFERGRIGESNREHAFSAIASNERDVQRFGIGKRVCGSSGRLLFLE